MIGISISIIFIFQGCTGENKDEKPGIGEKGNLDEIVIPGNADGVVKFAAAELQGYLKKITGKELQLKNLMVKEIMMKLSGLLLKTIKQ